MWYMDTGNAICLFLFVMPFITNTSMIIEYLRALIRRLWDRKWRSSLKFDHDDELNDEVNTR